MASRIERHQQMLQVMELRRKGGTLTSIAQVSGLSVSTVQRRITAALAALGSSTTTTLRLEADDRYSDLLRRAYSLLEPGVIDPKDHPRVLGLIRAVTTDQVRLWGVSVPAQYVLRLEELQEEEAGQQCR